MGTEPKATDDRSLVRRAGAMPRGAKTTLLVAAPGAAVATGIIAAPLVADATGTATHLLGSAGEIGLSAGAVLLVANHLASASNEDSGRRITGMLASAGASSAALGMAIAGAAHLPLGAGAGIGAPAGVIAGVIVGCVASSSNRSGAPTPERRAAWLKHTALGGVSIGLAAVMVDAAEQVSRLHPVSGHVLVEIGTGAAVAAGVAAAGSLQNRVQARRQARTLGEA